jgi:hypothetical protein
MVNAFEMATAAEAAEMVTASAAADMVAAGKHDGALAMNDQVRVFILVRQGPFALALPVCNTQHHGRVH